MTAAAASPSTIASRVADVRQRIRLACERVGRAEGEVTLVAASKTQPAEAIAAAWQAGVRDFGENYVQEGVEKIRAARTLIGAGPVFHFIGHLQRNKAREAAEAFAILQSVDSERLLEAICGTQTIGAKVMIQVNVGREATRGGVDPAGVAHLVERARGMPGIEVLGLMAVPPATATAEDARPYFRALRELAHVSGLSALSMGMTADFEVAIEEGATHVRVGRALFGERPR